MLTADYYVDGKQPSEGGKGKERFGCREGRDLHRQGIAELGIIGAGVSRGTWNAERAGALLQSTPLATTSDSRRAG